MANGDLIASNLAAFPALQIFCHRLQAENPECSLTVYLTLDGDYRLHLKANQDFPYFKLDHLFNAGLWGNSFLISQLSVAMDERKECIIALVLPQPPPMSPPRQTKRSKTNG